jgi:hypothetical protein
MHRAKTHRKTNNYNVFFENTWEEMFFPDLSLPSETFHVSTHENNMPVTVVRPPPPSGVHICVLLIFT